jgi:hypothetical protein
MADIASGPMGEVNCSAQPESAAAAQADDQADQAEPGSAGAGGDPPEATGVVESIPERQQNQEGDGEQHHPDGDRDDPIVGERLRSWPPDSTHGKSRYAASAAERGSGPPDVRNDDAGYGYGCGASGPGRCGRERE